MYALPRSHATDAGIPGCTPPRPTRVRVADAEAVRVRCGCRCPSACCPAVRPHPCRHGRQWRKAPGVRRGPPGPDIKQQHTCARHSGRACRDAAGTSNPPAFSADARNLMTMASALTRVPPAPETGGRRRVKRAEVPPCPEQDSASPACIAVRLACALFASCLWVAGSSARNA